RKGIESYLAGFGRAPAPPAQCDLPQRAGSLLDSLMAMGNTHKSLRHTRINTCLIAAAGLTMLVGDRTATGAVKKRESRSVEYKLVWHDEFDQAGRPNPQNWT